MAMTCNFRSKWEGGWALRILVSALAHLHPLLPPLGLKPHATDFSTDNFQLALGGLTLTA